MTETTTETRTPRLSVSTAIFVGDRLCLVERRKGTALGGLWSLPGGGVEFGETLIQAAAREALEETRLDCSPDELVFVENHEAIGSEFHAVIAVHAVRLARITAPVAASDAADARLVTQAELGALAAAGRTTPSLEAVVRRAASAVGMTDFADHRA